MAFFWPKGQHSETNSCLNRSPVVVQIPVSTYGMAFSDTIVEMYQLIEAGASLQVRCAGKHQTVSVGAAVTVAVTAAQR